MKHYERMVDLACFSRGKLAAKLNCGDATAASILQQYQKKGYIERVRHNFYVVISIENRQPIISRYEIGSRLFPDACVSHHSAFEVYGYANQVFYEVYVTTGSRFKNFTYDGVNYHRVAPKGKIQVQKTGGITITGIEQTVIDSINAVEKIGGLEEFLRCLVLVPSLNELNLLLALENYNNGFLYQKTGFILEQLNDLFRLSSDFYNSCKARIPKADRYLTKDRDGYIYHSQWRLIGPGDVKRIIAKGTSAYAAI